MNRGSQGNRQNQESESEACQNFPGNSDKLAPPTGNPLQQDAFRISAALISVCTAMSWLPLASFGKPPVKKLTYIRPSEPRYDSYSSAPGHFEFTVKKTQLLPTAEEILLKGSNNKLVHPPAPKIAELGKNNPLNGSVTKQNPLRASATGTPLAAATTGTGGRPLQGTVNSSTLKGTAQQNLRNSTLSTVQHGLKPRFYVDFAIMTPKFAPKLSRLIDSEIENARRTVPGDVARTEKLMNQELRARPPQPDVASIPAKINIATLPTKALQSELEKSKQAERRAAEAAKKQERVERASGTVTPARMPGLTGNSARLEIPLPKPGSVPRLSMPSIPKQDNRATEIAMKQELASIHPPAKSELSAQLAGATTQAKLSALKAQPGMSLVLTSLRKPQFVKMPGNTEEKQTPEQDRIETILWDQWHAKFTEASRTPILQALKQCGNPTGENCVEITVSSDKHMTVRIAQASKNATFDRAVLQAYRSLDGSPALKYPPGSRRSMLTFSIDVKHIGEGAPTSVKSQPSVGDTETVRKRK